MMANWLPRLPAFEAIILDMDGLVLDSEATYCQAWRQAAADAGHLLDEAFFEPLFGRHADDVVRALAERLGPGFERDAFIRSAERYWFELIHAEGIPRMPGVEALLRLMRQRALPFALATNSDGPYARVCLERGGLHEAFPVIVTRDQVAKGKPEPDVFLEAARRLGVEPSQCIVLEDSATGLLAARAAGAHPVLIQRRESLRVTLPPLAGLALASLVEFAGLLGEQGR
jgi:beta-phosphoglucomutase